MNIDNLTDELLIQPILQILQDKEFHSKNEVEVKIAQHFGFSIEDVNKKYYVGRKKLEIRVGSTLHLLRDDGYLQDKDDKPGKGIFRITEKGLSILEKNTKQNDSNQYFVIIDKQDFDKFRRLEYNTYENLLEKLGYHNCRFWAFSEKDKDDFEKIQMGDTIYFARENDATFSFSAKVSGKVDDSDLAVKIFGDDFQTKMSRAILFLDECIESSIGYNEMLRSTGKEVQNSPGLYCVIKKFEEREVESITPDFPEQVILPVDFAGPPARVRYEIVRYIRDTKKSRDLKKMYQNKCQACNYQIIKPNNEYYSEAHHVWPLQHDGDDDLNNILVLCPTHHAEFDYKVLKISKDGKKIVDKTGNVVYTLHFESGHEIAQKNIDFQLNGVK